MTNVVVSNGELNPTHDLSLSDGVTTYGLQFQSGPRVLQEMPLSPPAQQFDVNQRNWMSGRGFKRYADDNSGFYDSNFLWSTSDGKLFPVPQWRFALGIRAAVDESLPVDGSALAWWKLYGNDPTNKIARHLSIAFAASATYSADKCHLYIRRRGTPVSNLLTFELCSDSAGSPGTVLQTVTKTITNITDTVSMYLDFDWTGTQALTAATTYHLKIYGGAGDTAANHWEVLCNSAGTSSKYSAAGSVWTTSTVSMYYRVTDTDTARKWWFFFLEDVLYAVDQKDSGAASVLKTSGVRGTATSASPTTLLDTNLTGVSTNQFAGARIRIYDGTGDGQSRLISSNTTTQFTVPTWDITPDATSKYIVYGTRYWLATTGTPGLGAVKGQPVTADKTAYFPQGQAVNIRRMYVTASSHTFADDGTNKADLMFLNTDPSNSVSVYSAHRNNSTIAFSPTKVQGTPLLFGVAKPIGSSDYRINNLYNYNGVLYVFKEDGPYIVNGNRVDRPSSGFDDVPDRTTGQAVATQDKYLWWSWAHSVVRTLGEDSTDMMNWRQGYDGLPTDRTAIVTAIVSAVGWTFFALDGGADNYSTVLCWNGFGWHEIFQGFKPGVRIRNLVWQPQIETRGRLWIDIAGELIFMDFPLYAANPLKDTALSYYHEGVFTSSTIDANDALMYKIMEDVKILLEGGTIEVDYQTNANVGTNTWTPLGTASTSPLSDLTLDLGGVLQIRFRFRLQVTASRVPAILSGWMTSGRMSQPAKYQWVGSFRVATDSDTKTSETDHNPDLLYAQLQTWSVNQTKLTLRTLHPSSDNKAVTISLPSKSLDYIADDAWGGQIQFAILET